ncbi:TonB-dependent receptor [Flavobacterium lipolyticum]|uniref:TonB-dependent receptor plug domain-containing protein n=1 Tax=Flavobacterium lipolyticum TaxID=2893754 RepID=A0ABS8M0F8_9FLAO|nr:TonB-dependent receptor plug domain-containing protein [Flavobacterium sp. F-126]MCC9018275.1 TonB-dependent receptor plug domain-containing protein [Flavobacterium sp. F-126]
MQISRLMSLIALFFISLQGYSQKDKVNLTGVIVNHLGKTAEGVSVALKGTAYSTLTNNKGEYKISAKPGNYVLLVTHVGYKTTETAIFLKLGGKPTQDITMEEDMAALNEVAVTGKSKVQRVREQAYNITAIDLKKTYNTSADLNQVLNKTTGVRIREYGGLGSAFNFSLNGFSGNQVKFFLDGVPMDSYGSALTLNNIPVNMAERIDVYKGVVPIELGADALGGAVNIVTNKNVNRYIDASYSYGSFNTHRAAINTRFSGRDGFIANINAFANYADNDYKVDVSVVDKNTSKFLPEQKYKHFHDAYKSGTIMAEAGFKNKSFADYLLVGFAVAGNKKEIQQGRTMQKVVGQAFTDSESFITSLKFKKSDLFTKGLSLSVNSTYALVNNRSIDTSSRVYDWTGNYIYRQFAGANDKGELGNKTIYVYDEANAQVTTNLKYQLNEQHSLAVNYSYLGYKRKETNEYLKVVALGEPTIDKNILGLSYNFSGLDNRLAISGFGKMFDLATQMIAHNITQSSSSTNYGYGATSAYHLTDKFQIKGSYEHAYRLPSATEMLGDGLTVNSNIGLRPESSDNANLGLAFNTQNSKNHFNVETSIIYREAKDFIREKQEGDKTVFENLQNVQITGIDGVFRYGYKDLINFEVNGTYQKSLNKNKYKAGTTSPDALYDAQLPNVPIFYGNADLTFNFKNIRHQDDRLSLNVSANYIDAFYLTWPVLGSLETKKAIPEQFTQNAMVAYSFLNGKYNLAFECRNITDIKVYDYFKVQKPGRAFSVKFRYFLQ